MPSPVVAYARPGSAPVATARTPEGTANRRTTSAADPPSASFSRSTEISASCVDSTRKCPSRVADKPDVADKPEAEPVSPGATSIDSTLPPPSRSTCATVPVSPNAIHNRPSMVCATPTGRFPTCRVRCTVVAWSSRTVTVPAPAFATNTCSTDGAPTRPNDTACGPAPSCDPAPTARIVGSNGRRRSSSPSTTTVPTPWAAGPAMDTTRAPPSSRPVPAAPYNVASASDCVSADAAETRARSELGVAPTCPGAMSSGTVAATCARPIGTTVRVRSSSFAVTAYSPETGSGARIAPCARPAVADGGAARTGVGTTSGVGVASAARTVGCGGASAGPPHAVTAASASAAATTAKRGLPGAVDVAPELIRFAFCSRGFIAGEFANAALRGALNLLARTLDVALGACDLAFAAALGLQLGVAGRAAGGLFEVALHLVNALFHERR